MPRRLTLLVLPLCAACYFGAGGAGVDGGTDGAHPSDGGAPQGSWAQHVMHRLTRSEYDRTVRDLLGEPTSVASQLPEDQQSALGYDNDGIALVTSPLLVEQYFEVAGQLAASLFGRFRPYSQSFAIVPQPCGALAFGQICGNDAFAWWQGNAGSGFWGIRPSVPSTPNDLAADQIAITLAGTYRLSVDAFATPETGCATGTCVVELELGIDTSAQRFDITAIPPSAPQPLVLSSAIGAGLHSIRVASVFTADAKNPSSGYDRTAWVGNIHLDAVPQKSAGIDASAVLDCGGAAPSSDECTTHVLATFLPRAWRRPVSEAEIAAVKAVSDSVTKNPSEPGSADEKWARGVELALQEALTSSNFLYRPEVDPDPSSPAPHALSDWELASRLSYFLWSSMPDDELFARARDGTLHRPEILDAEVERMLSDPRSVALADDFGGQWLMTRMLDDVAPSAQLFPAFDESVRASMREETKRFFVDFLGPGKKFPDMIDAPYTFTDATLRGYYGLPPSGAPDFTATPLEGSHREGLLGQGSILTITSQPIRTSPVERGKFVLSRLLCNEPPPPPPNVPPFDTDETAGSVRQRLEQHVKEGPACSSCHDLLDPIGLALESFDAVGRYRTMDGPYPVDTSGLSYDGKSISDVASLAAVIKSDPGFVPCVSNQFWSYALGQQSRAGDAVTIAQLDAAAAAHGWSLRDMIHVVVQSAAFRTRAGGGS